MQFYPVAIVVSPLNALSQNDAKNIQMSLGKRIVSQSKATAVSEEKLGQGKYDTRDCNIPCLQNNQIAGPSVAIWNASKQDVHRTFNLCPWRANTQSLKYILQ